MDVHHFLAEKRVILQYLGSCLSLPSFGRRYVHVCTDNVEGGRLSSGSSGSSCCALIREPTNVP